MNDLVRLGLALIGFAVAVFVAGVVLGLVGIWIKRGRTAKRGDSRQLSEFALYLREKKSGGG
jgi:hypothetical protein